jgi:Magnesium chelatase, subunit ChlI
MRSPSCERGQCWLLDPLNQQLAIHARPIHHPRHRIRVQLKTNRVAGLTGARTALVTTRPCHAPPQTISAVGLIGGGHLPTPGDVSRAHQGMSALGNLAEFKRHLRQDSDRPSWAHPVVACADGGECPRAILAGLDGTSDLLTWARAGHTRMPQARRPLLQTVVSRMRRIRGSPLHVQVPRVCHHRPSSRARGHSRGDGSSKRGKSTRAGQGSCLKPLGV